MEWKNININKNNIETETSKAVLFKMPNNSNYSGFKFWHPKKLVREGRNKGSVSVGYTDSFSFKLIKNGQGSYNRKEVIDEKTISTKEFEEVFGVMDANIITKKVPVKTVEVSEPVKLPVEENKPQDELLV